MPDGEEAALREAAAHRGLKLVKSRRRKAGVGDWGRYGLTDGAGAELFGFGPDGLTALPADIRAYLRRSETSTWARSAETTPDRPKPDRPQPDRPKSGRAEHKERTAPKSIANHQQAPELATGHDAGRPAERANAAEAARNRPKRRSSSKAGERPVTAEHPTPADRPVAAEPKPELAIRDAALADLDGIGLLLGSAVPAAALAARLGELKRAGGGVIVADRGGILGCAAWQALLGLGGAPTGRLTLLLVRERERRRGVGRALADAAMRAMAGQGCTAIEAMSDIDLRNANGFFRALGYTQRSYRFVRDTPA